MTVFHVLISIVTAGCVPFLSLQPGSASQPKTATLPEGFFLEKEPAEAKFVEEAKPAAKAGEKILIRGRVGGNVAPFVEGRAVFTIVGPGIKACSDKKEEGCKTPWDYCCENAETIAKHSALIQVVDSSGAPLRTNMKGANGLKELSDVIVVGTTKEAKGNLLIIYATNIYIVKP